MADAYYV